MLQLRHQPLPAPPPGLPLEQPSLEVEAAGQADATAIAWLLRRCAPTCLPVSAERIAENIDRYRVIRLGGRVVASAAWLQLPGQPGRCELRSVAVDPRFESLGLGQRIVRAIIAEVRRAGVRLYCVSSKPGFFRRLGFDPVAADRVPEKAERKRWPSVHPRQTMVLRDGDVSVEEESGERAKRWIA